jgi:hypothetical protein
MDERHPEVWKLIVEERQLSDKVRAPLDAALKEFASKFVPSGAKDGGKKLAAAGA